MSLYNTNTGFVYILVPSPPVLTQSQTMYQYWIGSGVIHRVFFIRFRQTILNFKCKVVQTKKNYKKTISISAYSHIQLQIYLKPKIIFNENRQESICQEAIKEYSASFNEIPSSWKIFSVLFAKFWVKYFCLFVFDLKISVGIL